MKPKNKRLETISEDEQTAKLYQRRNRKKVSEPKDVEYYHKSMLQGINSRCGKKRGYKNIKNEFSEESYNIWFDSNREIIQNILKHKLIPSVERVNSKEHYSPTNCIILPHSVNSTLGRIHSIQIQLIIFQNFIRKNLHHIPKELQEYYIKEYLS